jgi:hypothetical protein
VIRVSPWLPVAFLPVTESRVSVCVPAPEVSQTSRVPGMNARRGTWPRTQPSTGRRPGRPGTPRTWARLAIMSRSVHGQPPRFEHVGKLSSINANYRVTFSEASGRVNFWVAPATSPLPEMPVQVAWKSLTQEEFSRLPLAIEQCGNRCTTLDLTKLKSCHQIIDDAVESMGRPRPRRMHQQPQAEPTAPRECIAADGSALPAHEHSPVSPQSQQPCKRLPARDEASSRLPQSITDVPALTGQLVHVGGSLERFFLRCNSDRCELPLPLLTVV